MSAARIIDEISAIVTPNAWTDWHTGCLFIPCDEPTTDDLFAVPGIGVSDDMSGEHDDRTMIVLYSNFDDEENMVMLWPEHDADALALIDELTELQPEGTDWYSWAVHYVTEIHVVPGSRETYGDLR